MQPDEEESDEEGCECTKDADGQCELCRSDTIRGCKEIVEAMTKFLKEAERIEIEVKEALEKVKPIFEDCCDVCLEQYADLGLSKLVSGFGGSQDYIPRKVFKQAKEEFARKGVKAMPLSDKAWSDLCASRGWTP